jgi:hydroxymethylpyrimidine/phosphomethylpyrimidine kinase
VKLSNKKNFLIIGGLDGTGGAGILCDFKAAQFLKLNPYVITTGTAIQSHTDFNGRFSVSIAEIQKALEMTFNTFEIEFVKIGMVGNLEIANTIIDFLSLKNVKIILDTPLFTTSGFELQKENVILAVNKKSFLTTPNLEEFNKIKNYNLRYPILVKSFKLGVDRLFYDHNNYQDFSSKPIKIQKNIRGTGCAYATAICSFLFLNYSLEKSIIKAKELIYNGILQNQKNESSNFLNFS